MHGIGDTLGNYKLLSRIGGGGAGDVYLACYLPNGQRVALKVPHPHHLSNRDLLARFFREARAINGVRHENVVDIVDFVEKPNHMLKIRRELPLTSFAGSGRMSSTA